MNRRGHAGRTDANHIEVVQALLGIGCTVQSLASVGLGCPDLVVGFAGVNILIEVKDGTRIASERKLTPDEKKWHDRWKGQICTVESPEEAIVKVKAALCADQMSRGGAAA